MDNLTAAKSQKAEDCPISFILDDQSGDALEDVTFFIRPEDMTRTYPSRISVNQTLGGAWVDSFGEGLETTTISGTLGWRTGPDGKDGTARLIEMRTKIYEHWHSRRAAAIAKGDDPNDVELIFVDTLNDYARVVVPQVFEIRRSKSRPLLASYRISFTAVSKASITVTTGDVAAEPSSGLDSLFASIGEIESEINRMTNYVNKTILAPIQAFMRLTARVLNAVHDMIQSGVTLAGAIINVARALTQCGVNIFRTLAAVIGIPALAKALFMSVAGAYSNAFCVLRNALRSLPTYEDYRGLFGASNCSSTAGGSPPSQYANQNPFFVVAPQLSTSVGVSPRANSSIRLISDTDPVFAPLSTFAMAGALSDINSGVSFA